MSNCNQISYGGDTSQNNKDIIYATNSNYQQKKAKKAAKNKCKKGRIYARISSPRHVRLSTLPISKKLNKRHRLSHAFKTVTVVNDK